MDNYKDQHYIELVGKCEKTLNHINEKLKEFEKETTLTYFEIK